MKPIKIDGELKKVYTIKDFLYLFLCSLLGHKDKKFLLDGDGVHLSKCYMIRVMICERCGRIK